MCFVCMLSHYMHVHLDALTICSCYIIGFLCQIKSTNALHSCEHAVPACNFPSDV